jgi:hypothetical protein
MTDTEILNWLEKQCGGALVNDDNGHWAFVSDGMQNIPMDDDVFDLEAVLWVEKNAFKSTIREAILHAVTRRGK